MRPKTIRWAYLFFLIVFCLFIFRYTFAYLTKPRPVSNKNFPLYFFAAGVSDDKQYSLLALVEYSAGLKQEESFYEDRNAYRESYRSVEPVVELIWNDEIPNYSYYLKKEDVSRITAEINNKFKNKYYYITIKILNDDKVNEEQTIYLEKTDDDNTYYSVYKVHKNQVVPLEYGDMTKADGFISLMAVFFTFIVGLLCQRKNKGRKMTKPCIFIMEKPGIDMAFFSSIKEAQLQLEAIDVKNDIYVGYDSEGRLLKFDIEKSKNIYSAKVIISLAEDEPSHRKELETAIRDYLKASNEPIGNDPKCNLNCLIDFCKKYL